MQSGGSSSSSPLMEFRRQQEDGNYTTTPPPPIRDSSAFTRPLSVVPPLVLSGLALGDRNGGAGEPKDHDPTPAAPSPTTGQPPPAEIRYRECLRNHAAAIGGHVLDGCGEFMPGAGDAMKCAACGCHRSFHRKDSDEQYGSGCGAFYTAAPHFHDGGRPVPLLLPPPPLPRNPHRPNKPFYSGYHPSPPAIAASGGTTTESSSEELNARGGGGGGTAAGGAYSGPPTKKRFRTKFTAAQKERMLAFAHGVGWRIQKQDEAEMERFCAEIGVSRQVLKVWMHNNKHISMIKKTEHPDHQHDQQQQEP